MIAANVVHTLDAKTLRAARKPGLYDSQITVAKRTALDATYGAHNDGKWSIMTMAYGARPKTDLQVALKSRMDQPHELNGALFFTERGDFVHLSGRGV